MRQIERIRQKIVGKAREEGAASELWNTHAPGRHCSVQVRWSCPGDSLAGRRPRCAKHRAPADPLAGVGLDLLTLARRRPQRLLLLANVTPANEPPPPSCAYVGDGAVGSSCRHEDDERMRRQGRLGRKRRRGLGRRGEEAADWGSGFVPRSRFSPQRLRKGAAWQSLFVGPVCIWSHSSSTQHEKRQVTKVLTTSDGCGEKWEEKFTVRRDPTFQRRVLIADGLGSRVG
jgi:hypothetical protein